MTPTTAEQMPDFKWLSDMANRLANGYVLNRAERQSFSEMHTLLNSWLAQGGARGVQWDRAYRQGWMAAAGWAKRDDLNADIGSGAYDRERERRKEIEASLQRIGEGQFTVVADVDAALAPRAEAGEAVTPLPIFANVNPAPNAANNAPSPSFKTVATDAALLPWTEVREACVTNCNCGPMEGCTQCVRSGSAAIAEVADVVAIRQRLEEKAGRPVREWTKPKEPAAACGVSGLADHSEDLLGMVRKWRASANRLTDNAVEGGVMAGRLQCADELEAALKANRGAASDAMVEAAQAAYTDAFADGNTHRHSWRTALTAALNAGALAGGEAVPEPDPKHRQLVAAAILGAQFTSEGLGMLQHDDMTASDFNPDEGDKG